MTTTDLYKHKYMHISHTDPFFTHSQVKFQEDEVIVREGAEGDTFYIILKGEVRQDTLKFGPIFPLSCCYDACTLYIMSFLYISCLGPGDKESERAAKSHP